VLSAVFLFYWFAFMGTIWAWLQAIGNLCQGKFIRSSIWFVIGVWLLFWWFDEPRDWEHFGPGACFFIAVGAFATFLRYRWERKAMLATPAWTTPADAVGNVENGLAVTQFGRPPMLGFNESETLLLSKGFTMKKLLLAGVAALFLATGTAHATDELKPDELFQKLYQE